MRLEFDKRWRAFCSNHTPFTPWRPDWDRNEITSQFEKLRLARQAVYFTNPWEYEERFHNLICQPDYTDASAILNTNQYQHHNHKGLSFSYNLASSDYNASIIIGSGGSRFLAFEAPQKQSLDAFYRLFSLFPVTHLVRLTPRFEFEQERCFPYWEESYKTSPLAQGSLHYFAVDDWEDNKGIDPEKLLSLVRGVTEASPSEKGMIAVHCAGGVGRTGTFIAAHCLIEEIDQQLSQGIHPTKITVSIEKIVWHLSLQRRLMVATAEQYLALHQLVSFFTHPCCDRRSRHRQSLRAIRQGRDSSLYPPGNTQW